MEITRTSIFSGITRTKELDITEDEMLNYMNGTLIQEAFPNLNEDDREFILTGTTAEEWDQMFGAV